MIARTLAGVLVALALAIAGRRARTLSRSGAVAAVGVGTAAAAAGWRWAVVLVAFFVASTALSRYRHAAKHARAGDMIEKGDARDAAQVLANGAVFASAALASTVLADPTWTAAAFGALAASTSDTWATEVGTLAARGPRSIVSSRPVPPGTSGGVTVPGTLASVAGAAFIATLSMAAGETLAVAAAILVGGVIGSLADSVAGATIQERRWCGVCGRPTERPVHPCGAVTRVVGGVRGVRNDLVNVLCSVVGAASAGWLVR